ncbi:restriction endonuclease [Candidatus Methanocrinis natronophilus]|uniref:Restriction endonuclease n=1 Tax=Candidatus Methanocrinis natronophilus TaxID=3033396 RepID=A0ABT5X6J4_9EURY|nr:restriction endonuclease [Candidatus Methanocrinis natronophilus]MDF0590302.1 restriction endonuclease [Candidatus Methanocrinis natronophilus]
MAVPDFQSVMLPLLKILGDGEEHRLHEVILTLADQFDLTDEERRELLPSGRQAKLTNRVGWARTYMKKAGLLESTGRGKFRINDRGLAILKENPLEINVKFLEQFPEFLEFRDGSTSDANSDLKDEAADNIKTPEEILEAGYQNLRGDLAQDLLDRIMGCSPEFFEKLVVDLLVAMGYGGSRKDAGEAVGRSGDGGIDGIIKEDKLGLDAVYIQAKRWEGTVGRPAVQAFAGSLMGNRAGKGVFITTSQFTREASDYVKGIQQPKIVLIGGEELAQFMIDHDIGVADVATYRVKRVDLDYFGEE